MLREFDGFVNRKVPDIAWASWLILRGALPNGVPNTDSAVPPLTINRTWLLVTVVSVGGAPAGVALMAFKLSNAVGLLALVTQALKRAQASAAKIPTLLEGACKLPTNGRAESIPPLKAPKNAESKEVACSGRLLLLLSCERKEAIRRNSAFFNYISGLQFSYHQFREKAALSLPLFEQSGKARFRFV